MTTRISGHPSNLPLTTRIQASTKGQWRGWHYLIQPKRPDPALRFLVCPRDKNVIGLPLIEVDEYVPLPLQSAYTTIYQARNFRHRLDYSVDPEPPLTSAQCTFIHQRLAEVQLRPGTNGVQT